MKPKRYFKKAYKFPYEYLDGVYFLISRKKIVYIGQTYNVVSRISHHTDKVFDSFRLITCDSAKRLEYERRWIKKFKPKYNRNVKFKHVREDKKIFIERIA